MSTLADGQLQDSKSAIYTVQRRHGRRIEQIHLFNDNPAPQTVILYIKRKGSVSRKLRQWLLEQDQAGTFLEPGAHMTITKGDVLEAETTSSNAVDFLITDDLV